MILFYNLKHGAFDRPPRVRILADAPFQPTAASRVIWVSDSSFYVFDQYFLKFGTHKMTRWIAKSQLSPEAQVEYAPHVYLFYGVYRKLKTETSAPASADNFASTGLASAHFGAVKQMAAKALGVTKEQYFVMLDIERRPGAVMHSLFPGDQKCELLGEISQDPLTLSDVQRVLRQHTAHILRLSGRKELN